MGHVGTNVCGYRLADGSQGNKGASFDARDRDPLGGISRVEDVIYRVDGSLGGKAEYSSHCGTANTPKTSKLGISSA